MCHLLVPNLEPTVEIVKYFEVKKNRRDEYKLTRIRCIVLKQI